MYIYIYIYIYICVRLCVCQNINYDFNKFYIKDEIIIVLIICKYIY